MPAGGFKTFAPGVLTSADVNDYLMQGVLVFNDSSERSTAVTSPVEGMVSYLRDDDVIAVYDGSTWVQVSPTSGARIAGIGTGVVNGGRSVSATVATTTVPGDLLVAVTGTIGGTDVTPAGWTQVNRTVSGASNFTVYALYTKVAVSGDVGASASFGVSPAVDTWGCLAIFSVTNLLNVTSVHGHDVTASAGTTLVTNAPSSAEGRKPLRFDVFAQIEAATPPTFSAYTGTGELVTNQTSSFNRMQVYATYDSASSASAAQVTSTANDNYVAAAFRVKG